MEYASLTFIFIFLPQVLCFYYLLSLIKSKVLSGKLQNILLFSAGLVFYAFAAGFSGLAFIIVYLSANHMLGLLIEKCENRKPVFILSVLINVLALLFFKYNGMVLDIVSDLVSGQGSIRQHLIFLGNYTGSAGGLLLPFAFSFIVFQCISYLADVYCGKIHAERNYFSFLLLMLLFVKTAQGPIMHYEDLSPQIIRRHSIEEFSSGISRFCKGLAKKALLADTLAKAVNAVWLIDVSEISTDVAWLGSILYALQIYFDFSGYSDMAIGLGKMFGFRIIENFNLPYISLSVREFWRRWHISLSSWFKEYLYIPLGGNRKGNARTLLNLFIVFLATGIWHGANLTFFVWGIYYALFVIIERLFLGDFLKKKHLKILSWLYTMFVVNIGWVIFRAPCLLDALRYIKAMFIFRPSADGIVALSFLNLETLVFLITGMLVSCPVISLFKRISAKIKVPVKAVALSVLSIILFILSCLWILDSSYMPSIYAAF